MSPDPFADVRAGCRGIAPLSARLEPWQVELCRRPEALGGLLELHGSPLNLIDPAPMARNAQQLQAVAGAAGASFRIFFARKANKALALVDEARRLGLGVDVASERELSQALDHGVAPADLVVTAAVKPQHLVDLCLRHGVTVVLDNFDELALLLGLAEPHQRVGPVALRLCPEIGRLSRFGFSAPDLAEAARRLGEAGLGIAGLHFHLDGYRANERVAAIEQSLACIDRLRELGADPRFIDVGGGIPMSYLDSTAEWARFWKEHREGLAGESQPLTFDAHGLGLHPHNGEVLGRPNVYPCHQTPVRGEWLAEILASDITAGGRRSTVAAALLDHGLELRCEPGRSLLDGCGITAAEVMFRKPRGDGTDLIGLAMNRTQCRSTADEFLVDPLVVPAADHAERSPREGYLVGAYCIERELLSWRRFRFPEGVDVGDLVVFPNTAGYQMHILESASHQIPLARNVIVGGGEPRLDRIDSEPGHR